MPKVSVVITTFNRADFLRKAIESVLRQTYKDFELLILDNSSTDNTENVVKTLNDMRIRYVRHLPMGISAARNLGVKEAKGEFIAFLDDDDEWLGNKLTAQIKVFEGAGVAMALVYGGFVWVDSEGKELEKHRPKLQGKILKDLLWQRDPFCGSASNPMLRKSAIEELGGYDESVKTGEDWELYLRLSKKYEIGFTPEIVVRIRQHEGVRLGDRLLDAANLEMRIMETHEKIFNAEPKLKSLYLQKIGGKLCRSGKMGEGRQYIIEAMRFNILNYAAYSQFILSFMGGNIYNFFHQLYRKLCRKW